MSAPRRRGGSAGDAAPGSGGSRGSGFEGGAVRGLGRALSWTAAVLALARVARGMRLKKRRRSFFQPRGGEGGVSECRGHRLTSPSCSPMALLLRLGCSLLALSTCLLPRARADCGRDCAACAYRLGPRADIHPLVSGRAGRDEGKGWGRERSGTGRGGQRSWVGRKQRRVPSPGSLGQRGRNRVGAEGNGISRRTPSPPGASLSSIALVMELAACP